MRMITRHKTNPAKIALSLVALVVLVGGAFYPLKANASYTGDNLISDSVYTNQGKMSEGEIQAFLSGKGSYLANYSSYSGRDNGNVLASRIIYEAAQDYAINPQVILATLQKEEGLITDPSPSSSQLNFAMGYGCPDSGSCSHPGFYTQVDDATWQFRYNYEAINGRAWGGHAASEYPCKNPTRYYTAGLYTGNMVGFKDDYGSVYTYLTLANASTASLYCYTPHAYPGSSQEYFSGSYNFVTNFEAWFGSTQGPLLIAHPDGTLVRASNSPRVYLIGYGGKAQYATSAGVFLSWGYNFSKVRIATQGDLNLIAATDADTNHTTTPPPLIYREGALVKGSGPDIFVIQNVSGVNHKRSLESWNNFTRLGYNLQDVITIPDSELSAIPTDSAYSSSMTTHPNGTLVRDANSPTVYYIINGERHSMTSLNVFVSQHFNFSQVKTSLPGDSSLPITWPVTWFGEGTLVKGSGPTVYVIDLDDSGVSMSKRSLGTYYNFIGLGYTFNDVLQVSDSELPAGNGTTLGQ